MKKTNSTDEFGFGFDRRCFRLRMLRQRGKAISFSAKSRDFNIPFNVGAVGRVPSELELEVSNDGGATWQVTQRSSPNIRSFHYLAPADGLYLFRLKTIDAGGRAIPSSDTPMQVIIDTDRPQGELTVDIDGQGMMIANFLVVEPHLNADSVRIEYRSERDQDWHLVRFCIATGQQSVRSSRHSFFRIAIGCASVDDTTNGGRYGR
ncbi:MAG: hypothetical protein U0905_15605 [Pirellulales bacterium]